MDQFSRSKSLNNIPMRKLQEKLLSVIRICPICSKKDVKTESISDGLCPKCALKNVVYNRFHEANIGLEYWDLRMEKDFVGDPRLLNLYNEIVADISETYTAGTSYLLAGSYGIGKTMSLSCILKKAAICGYNVLYTTLSDVVNVLTSGEDKYIARKELIQADFLIIDEFDQRYIGSDNASDLYGRTLESVLRTRAQNKLPLFMSTNSPNPLEMFNGSLKESLGSLMKGYLKVFVVLGDDFRKGNK